MTDSRRHILQPKLERIKQIVTLVATFLGILGPSLGFLIPGTPDTGEISGRFFREVPIIPADYTFAIWGPIYLGFLIFAVYQAFPDQRLNARFAKVRLWLSASMLLNAAWITVFGKLLFDLSAFIIFLMLVMALVMHRRLEIGVTKVYGAERFMRLPFSLYAAWLTAATILNVAGVLAVRNWDGFGLTHATWGVIMLLVASLIGFVTRFRWRDPVYGAVFVWTFVGVVVAQGSASGIALLAGTLAVLFALTLLPLGGLRVRQASA